MQLIDVNMRHNYVDNRATQLKFHVNIITSNVDIVIWYVTLFATFIYRILRLLP